MYLDTKIFLKAGLDPSNLRETAKGAALRALPPP